MSAWEAFKEAARSQAKPWHLMNPANYVDKETEEKRYSICLSCPELTEHTKVCKKCGCFMAVKTKLELSKCPLGKW